MYWSGINEKEYGNVYVREKGELRCVNPTVPLSSRPPSSCKLFNREFSVRLAINGSSPNECRKSTDHFVFTHNSEGNLCYMPRSLLDVSLLFIADNIEHVESLIGFPEQMADKLFAAAEAKRKFVEPSTAARGLRVFSDAYGKMVLKSLCLRERLMTLFLGANRLSDEGLRRLTAPVRVMKRGLEMLQRLDLSSNPVTEKGVTYLTCFRKLQELNLSNTNVQLDMALETFLWSEMSMVFSASPLQTFTHSACKTKGWAERVIEQWESQAAEIPQKNKKQRTNALQFYGREKFVKKHIRSVCDESRRKEKTSVLHFHTLDLNAGSEHAANTHTHLNTRHGKKRKFSSEQEDGVNTHSAAKCSATLRPLSAEDLELLGRY